MQKAKTLDPGFRRDDGSETKNPAEAGLFAIRRSSAISRRRR
jgi:hypothetical protein